MDAHDLRKELSSVLLSVRKGDVTREQVRSIVEIGQLITDIAKTEIEAAKFKVTAYESSFIPPEKTTITVDNVTKHRLR